MSFIIEKIPDPSELYNDDVQNDLPYSFNPFHSKTQT
jgi:hypothetical protein